jgi:hypothetical protein
VTATNTVELGTIREQGGDVYKYMYNNGNSQINPGQCVTITALTGYSVTVSTTTSISPVFGVVKHATMTTGTYGWVLTQGQAPLRAETNTGLAVADPVVAGTDGVNSRKTGATGYFFQEHAVITQATASAGLAFGWVKTWG